jgi:uncharacterized integral membrane protein
MLQIESFHHWALYKNKYGYNVIIFILIMIYLLTAIGLTPDCSSTVHIYTQTIYGTTQLTTLFGRLSGIRTQSGKTKINNEKTA